MDIFESRTYIYGLLCPVDNKIRYVGKSNDPVTRFKQHVLWARDARKLTPALLQTYEWIDGLADKGLEPKLVILEETSTDRGSWTVAEQGWIRRLVNEGHPLFNKLEKHEPPARVFQDAVALGREMFGA